MTPIFPNFFGSLDPPRTDYKFYDIMTISFLDNGIFLNIF